MHHVDRSIATIRGYRKLMEWSKTKLAIKAGLSEAATRGMDLPRWSPTIETLRKLEAAIPDDRRLIAEQVGTQ